MTVDQSRLIVTTGSCQRLQIVCSPGKVPWLVDALHPQLVDMQEEFDTYVRANSVLLAPGEAGIHQVHHFKTWRGVWLSGPSLPRRCPAWAADPDRGSSWVWRFPLVIGCGEHGCRLGDAADINTALALGEPFQPTPVDEPVATLDRYSKNPAGHVSRNPAGDSIRTLFAGIAGVVGCTPTPHMTTTHWR